MSGVCIFMFLGTALTQCPPHSPSNYHSTHPIPQLPLSVLNSLFRVTNLHYYYINQKWIVNKRLGFGLF
jgi:hypothetical protein